MKLKSQKTKSKKQTTSNPESEAWITAFFIENHLDHFTHPDHAATPEQIRFMIYLEEDERYYPCSKRMFEAIMSRKHSDFVVNEYKNVFKKIDHLISQQIKDKNERDYLKTLIRIKYEHEIRDQIMIPSRLEKRLFRIFLNRTQIEDPYLYEKILRNSRMNRIMNSEKLRKALNQVDKDDLHQQSKTLSDIREWADLIKIQRLFSLTANRFLWESDHGSDYSMNDFKTFLHRKIFGNGVKEFLDFIGVQKRTISSGLPSSRRMLWLADEAGEIMVDIAIIRFLIDLGHKIVLTVKDSSIFTKVDMNDIQEDEVLHTELEGALMISEYNLGKNELLEKLKSDYKIIVVSDGTRETLNLLLTSKTFARVFREVDAVISRGNQQKKRLFNTDFQFTQDIYNISCTGDNSVKIDYKPKHPAVIKFSHSDLEMKAGTIIDQMKDAKNQGMTVVFYSGIIGSIPGKIKMAKKIMTVFVQYLKEQSAMTFIINPSEFFEPGMDADDLMYMWEIVQRSGFIDIWRFQTYDDIAQAFAILELMVPPEWVGKDATFSTGCTKEMNIALDVQRVHPEMQIIGPAREKFMRRAEYGIGKMYDKRL